MGSSSTYCVVLNLSFLVFIFFLGSSFASFSSSSSSSLHPLVFNSKVQHLNYTAISEFRVVNRRFLAECPHPSPYLQISINSTSSGLGDEEFLSVIVSGVLNPSKDDWIAMISPSHSEYELYI